MPTEMLDQLGVPPVKERVRWIEWAVLLVAVVVAAGMFTIGSTQRDLQARQREIIATQQSNKEVGLRNRAVVCDLAKSLSAPEPQVCNEEGVAKYRDPTLPTPPGAIRQVQDQRTADVLCALLTKMGGTSSECGR